MWTWENKIYPKANSIYRNNISFYIKISRLEFFVKLSSMSGFVLGMLKIVINTDVIENILRF